MEGLHCILVTPDRCLFKGTVWQIAAPGKEGGFCLRSGHAPIFALLGQGVLEIAVTPNERTRFFLRGGFLEQNGNRCMILSEKAEMNWETLPDR